MATYQPASANALYENRLSRHAWAIEEGKTFKMKDRMSDNKLIDSIRAIRKAYKLLKVEPLDNLATVVTWEDVAAICDAAESTLLAPMMPPKPTPEMIAEMLRAWPIYSDNSNSLVESIYERIYRHLTKPKTKTVPVWRVLWAQLSDNAPMSETYTSEIVAREDAHHKLTMGCKCVSITGPEQQEVPA